MTKFKGASVLGFSLAGAVGLGKAHQNWFGFNMFERTTQKIEMPVVIYDQSIGGSVTKFKGASVLGFSLAGAVGLGKAHQNWFGFNMFERTTQKIEMPVVIYDQSIGGPVTKFKGASVLGFSLAGAVGLGKAHQNWFGFNMFERTTQKIEMPVVIYDQSIGGPVTKFKGASVLGFSLAGAVGLGKAHQNWFGFNMFERTTQKIEMPVVIYDQSIGGSVTKFKGASVLGFSERPELSVERLKCMSSFMSKI